MKKIFLVILAVVASISCSAETNSQRAKSIISKMSEKAQREISVSDSNMNEFLSDLMKVLEEERKSTERSGDRGLLYLLDKTHGKLGADYVPKNLVSAENSKLWKVNKPGMKIRADAKAALEEMVRAYDRDTGAALFLVSSAYRSFGYQKQLFENYVKSDGLSEAERYSARPGTSQHQLGAAMDFGSITNEFAQTRQGRWMYENAWKFGWSLSFPKGYEPDTGFMWESWHFRYIGKEACRFQKKYFNDVQQFMIEFVDGWKK